MESVNPKVTIIVTSHNRPEYLKEALQSLKNQTAPVSSYEVIVVKDYDLHLNEIDVGQINIKFIDLTETPLVLKHIAGIQNAKGSFIAFLDDDDLFSYHKIEHVIKASKHMTTNSFYFNRKNFFTEHLESIDILSNAEDSEIEIFARKQFDSGKLNRKIPWYNLSSMVVGRDLALEGIKHLVEFRTEIDSFWYHNALENADFIIHDKSALTFYRRHQGGVSRSGNKQKVCNYAVNAIESYEKMEKIFRGKITKKRITLMKNEWMAKSRILGCDANKNNLFEIMLVISKSIVNNSVKDAVKLLLLLLISLLSIQISSSIYSKFYL